MRYYELDDPSGFVVGIGVGNNGAEIDKDLFDSIHNKIDNKPTAPEGYAYKLRASDLEWELVELPPMPEPELTGEEALEILLGGGEA